MLTTAGIIIAALGGGIAGISTAVRLYWDARDRRTKRQREQQAAIEVVRRIQPFTEAEAVRFLREEMERERRQEAQHQRQQERRQEQQREAPSRSSGPGSVSGWRPVGPHMEIESDDSRRERPTLWRYLNRQAIQAAAVMSGYYLVGLGVALALLGRLVSELN